MAVVDITVDDVRPFVMAGDDSVIQALITGTLARAAMLAPCLTGNLDSVSASAAKDILVQVIARATEVGTGQVTTIAAGSFSQSVDTTQRRTTRFRPDEIRELQALCGIKRGGAFTVALTYDTPDGGFVESGQTPSPVTQPGPAGWAQ
jgi:hypothetical protein